MSQPGIQPKAVTIRGATELCGVGRSSVYQLIGKGILDARKSGRLTLIMVDSIERYLKSLPKADIRPPRKISDCGRPTA